MDKGAPEIMPADRRKNIRKCACRGARARVAPVDFESGGLSAIHFTNLKDAEKEAVRNWRNSPYIRDKMLSDRLITKKEHLAFIRSLKKDLNNLYWVVKDAGGSCLGVIALNDIDMEKGSAYLGIYKNPSCEIPGAGAGLMRCLKEIAFVSLRLGTLMLKVLRTNRRAVNFYIANGFRIEQRSSEFIKRGNRRLGLIPMSCVRAGFPERRKGGLE